MGDTPIQIGATGVAIIVGVVLILGSPEWTHKVFGVVLVGLGLVFSKM